MSKETYYVAARTFGPCEKADLIEAGQEVDPQLLTRAEQTRAFEIGAIVKRTREPEPEPAEEPPPDSRSPLEGLNAKDAVNHVNGVEDIAQLEQLFAAEQKHPDFEGGRETVLNAIRERADALKAE